MELGWAGPGEAWELVNYNVAGAEGAEKKRERALAFRIKPHETVPRAITRMARQELAGARDTSPMRGNRSPCVFTTCGPR